MHPKDAGWDVILVVIQTLQNWTMMRTLEKGLIYVLNPHYRLRHDIHRTILFATGTHVDADCSNGWYAFIHPLQAALLSFFTYPRTWGETLPLLCDFFCREEEEITGWVSGFVDNPTPLQVTTPQGVIRFPKRVLTDIEQVDSLVRYDRIDAGSFLWRKLDLASRRLYSGPLMVTLMLTNKCMTHCRYCYADTLTRVGTALSTPRIMQLIEEAAALPVQQVGLIGGEVFLHKDWKLILAALVRKNIAPEFVSTKLPMTPQLIQDLQETGYRGVIQVSLDACQASVLADMLGMDEHYVCEMMDGLRLLDASGLNYQISTVLTSYNCRVEVLSDMLEQLGQLRHIRDWRIVPVSNSGSKDYSILARLKPGKRQMTEVFDRMRSLCHTVSFPVILGEKVARKTFRDTSGGSRCFKGSLCSALTTHLFVLPDGKATVCEQLYWNPQFLIGDVTTQSLSEVWGSPRAIRLCSLSREDIEVQSPCRECQLFQDCFGYQNRCWSNIVKAYGREHWGFPDPRCILAPLMKNPLDYDN